MSDKNPQQTALFEGKTPTLLKAQDDFPLHKLQATYVVPSEGMVRSVKNAGVLAPIILVPNGDDGYKIVDGLRRTAAAREAKLQVIPVVIYDMDPIVADSSTMMLNEQRSTNPVAELISIERVMTHAIGEIEIANATGIDKKRISDLLKYRLLHPTLRAAFNGYSLPWPLAKKIVTGKELLSIQDRIVSFIESLPPGQKFLVKHLDQLKATVKGDAQPDLNLGGAESKKAKGVLDYLPFVDAISKALSSSLDLSEEDLGFVTNSVGARVAYVLTSNGLQLNGFDPKVPVTKEPTDDDDEVPTPDTPPVETSTPDAPAEQAHEPEVVQPDETGIETTTGGPVKTPNDPIEQVVKESGLMVHAKIATALREIGITTREDLASHSRWWVEANVQGIGPSSSQALKLAGLLHEHYDPDAEVTVGVAVGQRVRNRRDSKIETMVQRVVTGESGGVYVTKLDGTDQAFWKWDKFNKFFVLV